MAKANRGIYEPEFRLVLMVVVVILGAVGFFGFGASVHYATHWSGPVLTFGLANMALAFASTCVFGYVLVSITAARAYCVLANMSSGLLPKTRRGSIRRYQHAQFTYVWTHVLCELLVSREWTPGGFQYSWCMLCCCLRANDTIVDLWQEDQILGGKEPILERLYEGSIGTVSTPVPTAHRRCEEE